MLKLPLITHEIQGSLTIGELQAKLARKTQLHIVHCSLYYETFYGRK